MLIFIEYTDDQTLSVFMGAHDLQYFNYRHFSYTLKIVLNTNIDINKAKKI